MSTYVAALILGLGAGAVYAALGLGLVLIHRASGVVNVAHAAFAMYVTYQYAELRDVGDIVLPVVGLPPRIHLTDSPTFTLALTVSLAMAALLGLLVYFLIFRPLRHAPPVLTLVASVGLMIALQALAVLQFGSDNRFIDSVLPQASFSVFGVTVPIDRPLLAMLVAAIGTLMWAVSRWTLFGLATKAVAESDEAVEQFGYRPEAVAAVSWVVASVLGALAGILVAPISVLSPSTYTLFIVPALAAALLGGLSSFGATIVGALLLGMLQSVLLPLQHDVPWLNQPGLRTLFPLIALIAIAVTRGQLIPGRARAVSVARLPRAEPTGRPLRDLAVLVPVGMLALFVLTGPYRLGLERSLAAAVVCLSFVVLTGFAGQLSLAQMSLAGVAGFLLARLQGGLGVPFPLAPLLATAAATAAGLVLGALSRRIRGVDLAIVTLTAGVAFQEIIFVNPLITGGLAGSVVPPPKLFGFDLGVAGEGFPRLEYGLLSLAVFAACGFGVARLRTSTSGLRMLAVRSNERAASAVGVDAARTKLLASAASAGIAGFGGCLIGYGQGRLSFDSFGVFASLFFLAIASVGGVMSVRGAVLGGLLAPGGVVFTVLDNFGHLARYQSLLCGVALAVLVVVRPEGLAYNARRPQPARHAEVAR
ncbi:ABC transporter permease subunit [Protofrankia symbiont of Coriaria ruscifolia]|uniref:branched-chain amino acid ABC transporter permease n=1 Tax=Protofrankia symbiont of Coriaria ruscifolia TaxID=1306542 RepID=UPI0010414742|nr:ABC transporter permease [Protofrankia symbiont of Coriaria ruscifolia]